MGIFSSFWGNKAFVFIRIFVNRRAEAHKCPQHLLFSLTQGTLPGRLLLPPQGESCPAVSPGEKPPSFLPGQPHSFVNLPSAFSPSSPWTFGLLLNASGMYYTFLSTCVIFLKWKTMFSSIFCYAWNVIGLSGLNPSKDLVSCDAKVSWVLYLYCLGLGIRGGAWLIFLWGKISIQCLSILNKSLILSFSFEGPFLPLKKIALIM